MSRHLVFAIICLGMGNKDKALLYLETAFEELSDTMAILREYPLLEGLRSDAGFIALQRRLGYDIL